MIETVTRRRLDAPIERLVPHPRLPLMAVVDASRPAVHVSDLGLRTVGSVGADASDYGDLPSWERYKRVPKLAWHPYEPILMVAAGGSLSQWNPDGASTRPAAYRSLAFSPDGSTLWASPASGDADDAWTASDVVDIVGVDVIGTGPRWDTGVAVHPAGGLVLTLASDQGATLGLFALAENRRMRVRNRAVILDVDGYETPVWSPDGRRFAIRGNAYVQSLMVHAFPSLERELALELSDPYPGYPAPPDWTERTNAWSRRNIAFASDPDVLWIGTPDGTLISFDLTTRAATEHPVSNARVTALATTSTGELVLADSDGDLMRLSVPGGHAAADATTVSTFLDATEPVYADGYLWDELELTDGRRTWNHNDLAAVTEADGSDPTWLRLQAAINEFREP